MNWAGIPASEAYQIKPLVSHYVKEALEVHGYFDANAEEYIDALEKGTMQLWLLYDKDNQIKGVLISELCWFQNELICKIPIVAGGALSLIDLGEHGNIALKTGGLLQLTSHPRATGGWSDIEHGFGSSEARSGVFSALLNRIVIVGDFGKIAYSNDYGLTWTLVANNFGTITINDIAFDEDAVNPMFIAVDSSGQISRSINGLS
jgi:hypothetical protein